MPLAAKIPIRSKPAVYSLDEANRVLQKLKHSAINGAAVPQIR